jgi:Phage terminase large subunit gpA, ATPase domain
MRAGAARLGCRARRVIHPTRIIRHVRRGASSATRAWTTEMTDRLERFSYVWCDTCEKIQPMTFDMMPADDQNDHDAADIVCNECKSIIATLHAARR